MTLAHFKRPDLKTGFKAFASRPLSLTITLILGVVVSVISFLLLLFPVVPAYYYAVAESRREEFFIDLPNVVRTVTLLFKGIKKYFVQSYLLAFMALLPALALFVLPLIPLYLYENEGLGISLFLQLIWIPVFLFFGSLLLFGYPQLVVSNNAVLAFKSTVAGIKRAPLLVFILGFLTLVPFTAFVFHLFMVFTYPILAGWAMSAVSVGAQPDQGAPITGSAHGMEGAQEVTLGALGTALVGAVLMFVIIYGLAWLWGGTGFFVGLGISLVIGLYVGRKVSPPQKNR